MPSLESEWARRAPFEATLVRAWWRHSYAEALGGQKPEVEALKSPAIFPAAALALSLQNVIFAFGQAITLAEPNARIAQLEAENRRIRGQLEQLAKLVGVRFSVEAGPTFSEVASYLDAAAAAFKEAFGVPANTSVKPASDQPNRFELLVTSASSDLKRLRKARVAGARMRFFELLIERLPSAVFDAVDVEIKFPGE